MNTTDSRPRIEPDEAALPTTGKREVPAKPGRVKRCKAHHITDCFDCKNPVQTTQENPEFECVEVINGHE